jgi:hypothetical protein
MSAKRPEEAIGANAKLVVDKFSSVSGLGAHFGYNRESLAWVEGFIERYRSKPDFTIESAAMLVQVIGSYLGECVIHEYGGEWREREGSWGVVFDDKNAVFPFAKVHKQFQYGLDRGDSILGFFDLIGPVIFHRS